MSLPAVVILVVALVTLAMFAIMIIALVRQLLLLARTLQEFAEAVAPALDEISTGTERAGARSQALQRE